MRVTKGGVVESDIFTNMGRILGSVEITADGSLTDAGFSSGVPFEPVLVAMGLPYWLPTVSISGTTLTWAYGTAPANSPSPSRTPCLIVYGVS